MKHHWAAILALWSHAAALPQQAPLVTTTVSIATGSCVPNGASGGTGAVTGTGTATGTATGTESGGGSTGVAVAVGVVTSDSGEEFELRGCYAIPTSGNVLDGQSITTTDMTLSYCSTFCQGSSNYFAVENGNECICGAATPVTEVVGIGECSTGCVGNTAESCGASRYAIIYSSSSTPTGSTSDIVFTTTNSQGSTVITTSTSVAPITVPSDSYSVTVYTTTNPQGSTITTSSTSLVPISSTTGSTPVTVVTTTNSQGSTITTSITSTSSATPTLCPGGTGTTYSDADGRVYEIYCGTDYPGSDLPAVNMDSLSACLLACSNYVPQQDIAGGASCIAASWGEGNPGGNCYLKYAITEINASDGGISSGRLVSYNPPAPPISVTSEDGVTSTLSSASTTSTGTITSTSTAGTSSSTTSTSTINTSLAASPCPSADGSIYTDSSTGSYEIYCSAQFPGNDLPAVNEDTFEGCLIACDVYIASDSVAGGASCVAVSWGEGNPGGNCYLKFAITEIVYDDTGFCSGRRTNYNPPSPSSTTTSVSTTSTSSSSTSSSSSSSSRSSITSTTSSSSSTTSSSSSSVSTTSSSSTTSTTVTSISSAASPIDPGYMPTSTPVCPADNNTQYTDFAGSVYDIKCGLQITGENYQAVHADTFNDCIEYCDLVTDCAAITYQAGASADETNCYPYSLFDSYNIDSPVGVYSAVLANNGTTGEIIDPQSLCPGLNGSEFKDPGGYTYLIGCDQELNGADLAPAVAPDLSGCLQYCDTYATCIGVDFGPGANDVDNGYNCYPKSTFQNISYVGGIQFAQYISGP